MFISWMLTRPSFKKSLIVEQFQGNYLNPSLPRHARPARNDSRRAWPWTVPPVTTWMRYFRDGFSLVNNDNKDKHRYFYYSTLFLLVTKHCSTSWIVLFVSRLSHDFYTTLKFFNLPTKKKICLRPLLSHARTLSNSSWPIRKKNTSLRTSEKIHWIYSGKRFQKL